MDIGLRSVKRLWSLLNMREYKERHIYYFTCSKCGNKRQSFKRSRARKEICKKCRGQQVPENQSSIFDILI